jgi:hypothetical protein
MSTSSHTKFLAPEVLRQAVVEVADIARRDRASVVLVGGYALQLYGSPRLTGDIDVAAARPSRLLRSGRPLSFGGVQTHAPNRTPVDWIVRADQYRKLYMHAMGRSRTMRDVPVRVASPEDLLAMKMAAGRARDMADIEWLIVSGRADLKKARVIVAKYLGPYAATELDSLVAEARWKKSRGRV